jgi:hypothetical protein
MGIPYYSISAYSMPTGEKGEKAGLLLICYIYHRNGAGRKSVLFRLAEGVGFEPTFVKDENGFQDRRHRPLGHPSGVFLKLNRTR